MPQSNVQPKIIRRHEVCQLTALSYSTLWRLEKKGQFCQRVRLSANSVGWLAAEVSDWCATRERVVAVTP